MSRLLARPYRRAQKVADKPDRFSLGSHLQTDLGKLPPTQNTNLESMNKVLNPTKTKITPSLQGRVVFLTSKSSLFARVERFVPSFFGTASRESTSIRTTIANKAECPAAKQSSAEETVVIYNTPHFNFPQYPLSENDSATTTPSTPSSSVVSTAAELFGASRSNLAPFLEQGMETSPAAHISDFHPSTACKDARVPQTADQNRSATKKALTYVSACPLSTAWSSLKTSMDLAPARGVRPQPHDEN
jgi:hypothetical protein